MKELLSYNYWKEYIRSGELVPFFQPIVSCETGEIYGYEVLGRIRHKQADGSYSVESLGNFFLSRLDSSNHSMDHQALKKDVDNSIRELSLRRFVEVEDTSTCIFLNVSPSSILEYLARNPSSMPFTVEIVRSLGIDPRRIVVEITEEPISSSLEILQSVIDIYRNEGFRIAVDDVGSESSNLDRIGLFHPDIIKVDLQMLRRSVFSRNFKEILLTLSRLGESLGSSLLFEGIENEEELENALNYGSRYLQGYFFSKPIDTIHDKNLFRPSLSKSLKSFHDRKLRNIEIILDWERTIESMLSQIPLQWNEVAGEVVIDEATIGNQELNFFRLYVTDSTGNQVSPNYSLGENQEILVDSNFLGKNWSWRPYFYEHFYKTANSRNSWVVSSVYHDINDNITLKTFSRNLKHDLILFIDVIWDMS